MKSFLLTTTLACGLATTAVADTDWSGFYVGLTGGNATGDANWFNDGDDGNNGAWDSEGSVYGGFAGYNIQRGNVVYGGELSYMQGDVTLLEDYSWPNDATYNYSGVLDAKARVGFATDSALMFATAGYSSANLFDTFDDTDSKLTGYGYGVGVDFMVTEKIFLGVEYFTREIEGPWVDHPDQTIEGNVSTITVRAGMKF